MKVKLYCEDVETHCAWNDKDAHLFRKEIHGKELDLAYMPNVGETIILHTNRGWVDARIGCRGISHSFEDADSVRDEFRGKTTYGIWFDKITIMEHYVKEDKE